MSPLNINKNNWRALIAAIVASGTDDLNIMFLAFSMSTIITDLHLSAAQAWLDWDNYQLGNARGRTNLWFIS